MDRIASNYMEQFTDVCPTCKGEGSVLKGSPTYYRTIMDSPEWQAWVTKNEQDPQFDVHESMEMGWLSPEHFAAFLEWVRGSVEGGKMHGGWHDHSRNKRMAQFRMVKTRAFFNSRMFPALLIAIIAIVWTLIH